MKPSILLITGWGGGTQLLYPLQQALQQSGHGVEVINIFNALDEAVLQEKVALARHYDVIIGWSLGGQLAAILVDEIEKQHRIQKVLITLASNPCFVANKFWPYAMPVATFQAFQQSFAKDAISTLKRFGYLVCQGLPSSKSDLLILQSLIQPQQIQLLQQGLLLLEQLNVVDILRNYSGAQYHVLATQDGLVPHQVSQDLQNLAANSLQTASILGAHGFPVTQPIHSGDQICQYLAQIKASCV